MFWGEPCDGCCGDGIDGSLSSSSVVERVQRTPLTGSSSDVHVAPAAATRCTNLLLQAARARDPGLLLRAAH